MIDIEKYREQLIKHNSIDIIKPIARGLGPEDAMILMHYVDELKSGDTYVEIGTSEGYSLLMVAGFRPDINCYGIEINSDATRLIKDMAEELNFKNVNLITGDSMEACKEWDKKIDLLFIDGDHMFPQIFYDFVGWYPFVETGKKILFHDFEKWQEGKFQIGLAARVFQGHNKYNFYSAALNDGISSSIIKIIKP
jgi:hypothetical protein